MEERKETVRDIDGNEKEITISYLSAQRKNEIFKECIKIGVKGDKNTQNFEMNEVDMFGMKNKVLQATVKGIGIDRLYEEDGDKIYDKYFGHLFSFGGDSTKN